MQYHYHQNNIIHQLILLIVMTQYQKNLWKDGGYIPNEVAKFSAWYSTVDRKRGTTRVWFIGNTITKANPYIHSWGLLQTINKMKQGDIITVNLKNADGEDIPFAIEYCKSSGGKSMTIGASGGMVDKGYWQADIQPQLPLSYNKYKVK